MSVVGFDFGNESCVVAVARQTGIEVVLNNESNRETPAIVCFGDKQRFIGTTGVAPTMINPKNSISQIKRLIGRQFSDPELQKDLKSLPFDVTEGPDGYPLIHAQYLGEVKTFTPNQILGMVFSDLKVIAKKNLKMDVVDCCIGIPAYFTDLQRRAVLDAATIAGLRPLCLIHETTATALEYGIYKTDLPESEQVNVAFVDIGHASMQVCIAGFKKGQLKILSHASERSLGGRDFDEVIFQHFVAKFREEYKIDVLSNTKACLRLRASCEKAKKVLSANAVAQINIECLMDDKDVRGLIKREEFEQIAAPILECVKRPLEKALVDAGLTVDHVHTVEVVGSGSRVPAIIRILTGFFQKEPRRTMNASECVARGAALHCALFRPKFLNLEFQVNEWFPASIALTWKVASTKSQAAENQDGMIIFRKGNPIPSVYAMTFNFESSRGSRSFPLNLLYANASELQAPAKISTYAIGPFQSTKRVKIEVTTRLNLHGIVSIESAILNDDAQKTNIPVAEVVNDGKAPLDLQKAFENEIEMASRDREMEEAKDKRNALESYVYDMRNQINGKYHDFISESEKEQLMATLQDAEDWLYQDGVHETKDVYLKKLEELIKLGDPIEERYKEFTGRGTLIDHVTEETKDKRNALESYIYDMRNQLNDKYHDFINESEKEQLMATLQDAEDWLYQDGVHETKNVYLKKLEELIKLGDPIEERYKEFTERGTLIDHVTEETKDKRNALESYIYDMRNQLNDKYHDFINESEKEQLMATLQEVKNWLHEDGEDKTKDVYLVKLEELKKQGDPIEERFKEFTERGTLIDLLVHCINSYRDEALSNDTMFDHIHMSEKLKVLNQCAVAEAWLREKKHLQDALPKYANPVLLSADLTKKSEVVVGVCSPIMTKPKPGNIILALDEGSAGPSRVVDIWLNLFSSEELKDWTDDFSRANFLGDGGFAQVYKGSLSNGRKVAVKVLRNENSKAEEEFRNELDIISRARHRNIVSLVGYCITQTKRFIVYEFVENRSLQDHLQGGKDIQVMDWAVRIQIARGSAKGFAYLHEECPQKIIHGDFKPADILLDFSFVPQVANFGISKLYPDHSNSHNATYATGSKGFKDPVYQKTKELSAQSDVYAFGVFLLMLISGQTNLVTVQGQINLVEVNRLKDVQLPKALKSGKYYEIADKNLIGKYKADEMIRMLNCANACLRKEPRDRPDMSQVSRVLENIVSITDLNIKYRPR